MTTYSHAVRLAACWCVVLVLAIGASPQALAHTHAAEQAHSHPLFHTHASPEHRLSPSDFENAPYDLVLWGELEKAALSRKGGQYHAKFTPPVLALEGKTITLIGFMAPIHAGERQKQFLLSDTRFLCTTCQTAPPPQSIVEVNAEDAQPVYEHPIRVCGKLELVRDSRYGLMYRLLEAVVLQP